MARTDGRPENQHYVPQLLLRLHANDPAAKKGSEQVWVFDKQTGKVFSPNIKGILAETRFYEVEFNGKVHNLEQRLTRLEDKAAPVLTEVVRRRSLDWLGNDGRLTIAVFVAVQFARTQTARGYVSSINDGLAQALRSRGIDTADVKGFKDMTADDVKALSMQMLVDAPKTFAPYFLGKHWYLIAATGDDPFVVGDNPVVRDNDLGRGGRGPGLGLAMPGVAVYLPLCPTLCLAMADRTLIETLKRDYNEAKRRNEREIKRASKRAKRSGVKLDGDAVSAFTKRLQELHRELAPVMKNGLAPYNPQIVMRVNSLETEQASRWLVSSKDDFSLPLRMIADNEAFRGGPRIEVG